MHEKTPREANREDGADADGDLPVLGEALKALFAEWRADYAARAIPGTESRLPSPTEIAREPPSPEAKRTDGPGQALDRER